MIHTYILLQILAQYIFYLSKFRSFCRITVTDLYVETGKGVPVETKAPLKSYNIAVASISYVGLSIATLLAQHNHVTAVDIIPEKVDLINNK